MRMKQVQGLEKKVEVSLEPEQEAEKLIDVSNHENEFKRAHQTNRKTYLTFILSFLFGCLFGGAAIWFLRQSENIEISNSSSDQFTSFPTAFPSLLSNSASSTLSSFIPSSSPSVFPSSSLPSFSSSSPPSVFPSSSFPSIFPTNSPASNLKAMPKEFKDPHIHVQTSGKSARSSSLQGINPSVLWDENRWRSTWRGWLGSPDEYGHSGPSIIYREYDADWKLIREEVLKYNLTVPFRNSFKGLQDARGILHEGEYYLLASYDGGIWTEDGKVIDTFHRQCLFKPWDVNSVIHAIPPEGERRQHQKNWAVFKNEGESFVLYMYYPKFRILHWNWITGSTSPAFTHDGIVASQHFFEEHLNGLPLHGTTNPIKVFVPFLERDAFLTIPHKRLLLPRHTPTKHREIYYHYFYLFECKSPFQPIVITPPYHIHVADGRFERVESEELDRMGPQFISGLWFREGRIYLAYGIMDEEGFIVSYEDAYIWSLFEGVVWAG